MAVKIRLNRIGTKKRPYYRVVASDSRSPQGGRLLEILGTYDPLNYALPKSSSERQEKGLVNLKTDRVQYWLSVGAQPTDTVRNLLDRLKIKSASSKKVA